MHVERLACLQVDVACVRSVCVYTLSKVTAFYMVLKQKKLVLNAWQNGDITHEEQWGHLFIHATNHAADKAAIYRVKPVE